MQKFLVLHTLPTGERLEFNSILPNDLENILKKLRNSNK